MKMRNFKAFLALILLLSPLLFSCGSDDDGPEPPVEEQLPPNTVTIEDKQVTYTFAYVVFVGDVILVEQLSLGFSSWILLLSNYDLEELVDEEFNFTDPGDDFSGYYAQIVGPLNSNVNGVYQVVDVDIENIDIQQAGQFLGQKIAPDVEFGFDYADEDFDTIYSVVEGTVDVNFNNNVLTIKNDLITSQGLEIKYDFQGAATFIELEEFLGPNERTLPDASAKFSGAFKNIIQAFNR
ncbi:hypothetical protein [Pararhodonellum marinum]|uniref:hypothetical protein n=1 Tax=Pararhodonellum marinum TaxID=2755358 RepID=UPI00188FD3FF|nr:hypothetical protein [Pararhodonellum marinum]